MGSRTRREEEREGFSESELSCPLALAIQHTERTVTWGGHQLTFQSSAMCPCGEKGYFDLELLKRDNLAWPFMGLPLQASTECWEILQMRLMITITRGESMAMVRRQNMVTF